MYDGYMPTASNFMNGYHSSSSVIVTAATAVAANDDIQYRTKRYYQLWYCMCSLVDFLLNRHVYIPSLEC